MSDCISRTVENGIVTFAVQTPPNQLVTDMVCSDLAQHLERDGKDSKINAIIINLQGVDADDYALISHSRDENKVITVCGAIEDCPKPVIAALTGCILGDMLALAMSAHFRVVQEKTQLRCPEVQWGTLVGAGITQRSPRLIGPKNTMDLFGTGRALPVAGFGGSIFVDAWAKENALAEAKIFCDNPILSDFSNHQTKNRREGFGNGKDYQTLVENAREGLNPNALMVQRKIIDCIEVAQLLPFSAGLDFESEAIEDCRESDAHFGLKNAIVASHQACQPPCDPARAHPVKKICILGAGGVGLTLTRLALLQGLDVQLVDPNQGRLDTVQKSVAERLDQAVSQGEIQVEVRAARLAALSLSQQISDCADCDLILEIATDDLKTKQAIFSQIAQFAKETAVLATMSATTDLSLLAEGSARANDIIALYFRTPIGAGQVVEVAGHPNTKPEALATGFSAVQALSKQPVYVNSGAGLVGARLNTAFRYAALELICLGATPAAVDQAARGFGFPIGPFQQMDRQGLDIAGRHQNAGHILLDPNTPEIGILDEISKKGWMGRRSGRGFYTYSNDGSRLNPDVEPIVAGFQTALGVSTRTVRTGEIRRRLWMALCNHGGHIMDAGIAESADTIDAISVLGYGYPRLRGGPMHTAERAGLSNVVRDLKLLERENPFWKPSNSVQSANLEHQMFKR